MLAIILFILYLNRHLCSCPDAYIDWSSPKNDIRAQVEECLISIGFFVIRGHGLSPNSIQYARNAALDIFALPNDTKTSVSIGQVGYGRGYISFGSESGLQSIHEPKEGYSYGANVPLNQQQNSLQQENKWPQRFPHHQRQHLEGLFDSTIELLEEIVTLLSIDRNFLDTSTSKSESIMRIFHYFNYSDSSECVGSSPHTDWGLLTAILQDKVNGLQFYHNNRWNDVIAEKNDIIINAGDYLSYVSNGKYHSPIHRVLCPKDSNRMSFVLFYYPSYSSPVPTEGHRVDASIEYNTLFDSSTFRNDDNSKVFGDYIVEKWRRVRK